MQLSGIRGTIAFVLVAVVAGILAVAFRNALVAFIGGVVGGLLIAFVLFRIPAIAERADRADRWLSTPK